jgi:predicted nuclease of predicted toxin-antitoxin system
LRLLVDQNLPRRLASLLEAHGYDVAHTEDVGLATTADPQILSWCCAQDRVLVTADKKLTKFLAASDRLICWPCLSIPVRCCWIAQTC